MNKKHEIIELVVKVVCEYFEIGHWKRLCNNRLHGREMHARYICVYLLSKYLRVPVMSVRNYFDIGVGLDSLVKKTNTVVFDVQSSDLPYSDAVQKLSFLIENSILSKADSYKEVPSAMIKKYNIK